MRQKGMSLNIRPLREDFDAEDVGDDHVSSSHETPMRADAFDLDDEEKIQKIEGHFREIMHVLGLDMQDDSLNGTPHRVAKMFVREAFSGLNPKNKPHVRLFENKYNYDQMLVEKEITFYSHCEHHFVPIYGKVHVAYFSSGKVIGLSKINRIVQYFAKRPQVQERLTVQIGKEIERVLHTESVAVVIDANHMCVASRGVGDTNSKTGTAYFSGNFKNDENVKREFLNYINTN
ncbi:MAG: GTP cyclohydrolase I FolE [Flammeovirgaceae bacterium]|nr:GTP cyclohydrolase I FolE [Flammeovirgaceae bacterium]